MLSSIKVIIAVCLITGLLPGGGLVYASVSLADDGHADWTDLSIFASQWLRTNCLPDNCGGADINGNGKIDFQDFALLAQYWLTDVYSGQVVFLNPSFELDLSGNPSTVVRGFDQVLGWTPSTTNQAYLKVSTGGSDGNMYAFFKRNGQYIYQTLNRTIAAGECYVLTFDAANLYMGWAGGITELCYQDLSQGPNPISIPGAVLDCNAVTGGLLWSDFTDHLMLIWQAQAGQPYIGKKLIIRHRSPVGTYNVNDGIYGIDNFKLSVEQDPCIPISNLYVATNGNDTTGDGSLANPFLTIGRAQQTVRVFLREGLTQDVHVYIREGTYYLSDTLVFDKRDTVPTGHKVIYEAYSGESPVISGGYKLTGTWNNTGGDLWTIQLPPGTWFRQLWCGDDRCQRSRWPNPVANPAVNGMLFITSAVNDCLTITLPQNIPGADSAFINSDTEAVMYHRWASSRAKIVSKSGSSFNTDTVLGMPGDPNYPDYYIFTPNPEHRVHLEHNLAFIDQATEWYLSRSTGLLTYQAPAGTNPNDSVFTAPKLEKLIIIKGDVVTAVQGLIFRGLSFKHTTWEPADLDYTGDQHIFEYDYPADDGFTYFYEIPPAIAMIYANYCNFEHCRIANIGAMGIGLGKGCNNNQVVDCEFYDISATGVMCGWRGNLDTDKELGGMGGQYQKTNDWNVTADIPHNNIISDNYLHTYDDEWFGNGAICDYFSKYTQITNNTIAGGPYSGLTAGFRWDSTTYSQQGTNISQNHIYGVMNLLNDGAGIYTLGNFQGATISGNLVHDVNIGTRSNAGWMNGGIYHDQGTSNLKDTNNITYNIAGSDLWVNGSADHVNLTYGTNYWGYGPSIWNSTVSAIAAAAGVQPVAPTLSIAFDSNGSNIIVTGTAGKAWAQLGYARIQEDGYDVTAELTVKENGFIYGVIPLSLVGTNTVTIQATVSTAEGELSSPGVSNTLSISPFSPPQPVYLVAWFRADGSVTKDASGNVSGWQDASGNNNNAAPPAVKPLWVAGQVNGLPVVRFANASGTSATLLQTAAGALPAGSNLSVFVVAKHRSATAGSSLLGASDGGYGASNQWFILDTISDSGLVKNRVHLNYNASISGTVYDTPTDTSFHVQSMVWNGDTVGYTNSTLFYNIDDVNTLSNIGNMWYLNPIAPIDIGGYDHLGGYYSSDVDIAEILIYKAALSSVDQASITNYLKAKYRLPVITQPTQLPQSASLVAWFKADSGVTKDASNNVSGWNDASSAGHNATATVLKPQWIDAQINGLPIIRFTSASGSSANLLQTAAGAIGTVTQLSVFAVYKNRTSSAGNMVVGASNIGYTGSQKWFVLDTQSNGGVIQNRAALNSDSTYKASIFNGSANTSFHVQSMVWTGGLDNYNNNLTRLSLRMDNNEQSVNANGVWTLSLTNPVDIGGYDNMGAFTSTAVDIAEIIIYNTALSAADRQSVHDYLDGKYALNY
jgi:hypothetical protein